MQELIPVIGIGVKLKPLSPIAVFNVGLENSYFTCDVLQVVLVI